MLSLAATMELTTEVVEGFPTVTVNVTNETGHKLPSGYPEGRRIWLNVRAYDSLGDVVYESGAYDLATGILTHDNDLKIYEIKPGISTRLSDITGVPAGPSFNFALNDTVYKDNRIPPRGFNNAAFEAIQSPVVGYSYADGAFSDASTYTLPISAREVEVFLYYQTTSKEYIEFLRDENVTNDLGQRLYDSWVNQGRSPPVAMADDLILLDVTAAGETPGPVTILAQNHPNPFNPSTRIRYSLSRSGPVRLSIFDERGRLVRNLVDEPRGPGRHQAIWNGTDERGRRVASGVYHYVLRADGQELRRKMVLVK
jgi:hypothetical protein